jgi:predicted MFS family arabinose efflux permease
MKSASAPHRLAKRFPHAAPDGLVASVLLAFLATAGLFYVNIMPALVSGLVEALHFSPRDAGFVASANVYGAALGALLAAFLIRRLPWRPTAITTLLSMAAIDLISILIVEPAPMIPLRFLHGTIGGVLVGVAFSVIARTRRPDQNFGMLLVVSAGMGGLGLMVLPRLVPIFGAQALFLALAGFSALTLAMIPFIGEYPVPKAQVAVHSSSGIPAEGRSVVPLSLALLSVFLFQGSNMALSAYIIELGRAYGLETNFISTSLGLAGWIGAVGSLIVVKIGVRWGRVRPLAIGLFLAVASNAAYHWSVYAWIYAGASILSGIAWFFTIPYLLGLCAAFDRFGRAATFAGFASKMGLATGPLAASLLLDGTSYTRLINLSVTGLALSGLVAIFPARLHDRVHSEMT